MPNLDLFFPLSLIHSVTISWRERMEREESSGGGVSYKLSKGLAYEVQTATRVSHSQAGSLCLSLLPRNI